MVEQINQRPTNEPLRIFSALGASNMVYSDEDNFVQFSVKGDRDVNKVKVIYDQGQDLYNIEFYNINLRRKEMVKKLETLTGMFNDQLTDAIWRRVVLV